MSSIITNSAIIRRLANDLIKARQLNYSEECINYYVNEKKFTIENVPNIKNKNQNALKCTLIKHKVYDSIDQKGVYNCNFDQSWKYNSKCIIFLHGLGSTRLQAFPIVESLPKEYCLFTFDFSGSGKSQGENITYGLRECDDIDSVLQNLYQKMGFKEFIIWGRSMGAVASLLYAIKLAEKAETNHNSLRKLDKIKCLVLDSPFSSFDEITRHIAKKKFSVPEFLVDTMVYFMKESLQKIMYNEETKQSFNPFQIKFNENIDIKVPAVFLYSQKDDVVPMEHSEDIISRFRSRFQKIIMEDCPHNENRPKQIINRVFQAFRKLEKRHSIFERKNSIDIVSRNGSMNRTQNIAQYRKSRGIFLCTPSKELSSEKTTIKYEQKERRKSLYSVYSTLKMEPKNRKVEEVDPKNLMLNGSRKRKNEEKIVIKKEVQTISYEPNDLLKKKLAEMNTIENCKGKRRNSRLMNVQSHGDNQIILSHMKYL